MISFLLSMFSCFNRNTVKDKDLIKISSNIDNINNSPHTFIKFKIEDEKCNATINEFFRGYKHKSDFPYSLWITVETKDENGNGYPSEEEGKVFDQLEDSIIRLMDNITPYCFIGRTTRKGYREIMLYVSDKSKTNMLIGEFVKKDKFKRKIQYSIQVDKTWESVSGFIE